MARRALRPRSVPASPRSTPMRWLRHVGHAALVAATLTTFAACAPAPPAPPPGWAHAYISRDGGDVTDIAAIGDTGLHVRAPTSNTGGDGRSLLWRTGATAGDDQTSCVTTSHSGWPVQEGVALRISASPLGDHSGTRAVTVQKNIWARADSVYNVHLWDTTRADDADGIAVSTLIESTDMAAAVADTRVDRGRRLCARVTGRTVDYKVWPAHLPEPSWDDPTSTHRVSIPPEWVYAGRPGLYIAHLEQGAWADMTDHTTVVDALP